MKKNRPKAGTDGPVPKLAKFVNKGDNPIFRNAELYYEDQFWGRLGTGEDPHRVNTYPGQIWNIMVDGEIKKTFVIGEEEEQTFTF